MLKMWLQAGRLTQPTAEFYKRPTRHHSASKAFEVFTTGERRALGKSLLIRHLDVGSNNAEEAELVALSNPDYDIVRFGIEFTASPRHADILAVTGPVTRQLKVAMERTYQATPKPCLVVAIGDGACYGTPYSSTYACLGAVDRFLPVDMYIPGDPPSPSDILAGLLACKQLLMQSPPHADTED